MKFIAEVIAAMVLLLLKLLVALAPLAIINGVLMLFLGLGK